MMGQPMMQMCSMMSEQGMMGGQSMIGMMGMQTSPAELLAAADQLALTGEQVGRLEALRDHSADGHAIHMRAGMRAQRAASQILAAEQPDLDAYRRALDEAAEHMVMAHVALTRAAVEAVRGLSENQKAAVEDGMVLSRRMMHRMDGR